MARATEAAVPKVRSGRDRVGTVTGGGWGGTSLDDPGSELEPGARTCAAAITALLGNQRALAPAATQVEVDGCGQGIGHGDGAAGEGTWGGTVQWEKGMMAEPGGVPVEAGGQASVPCPTWAEACMHVCLGARSCRRLVAVHECMRPGACLQWGTGYEQEGEGVHGARQPRGCRGCQGGKWSDGGRQLSSPGGARGPSKVPTEGTGGGNGLSAGLGQWVCADENRGAGNEGGVGDGHALPKKPLAEPPSKPG